MGIWCVPSTYSYGNIPWMDTMENAVYPQSKEALQIKFANSDHRVFHTHSIFRKSLDSPDMSVFEYNLCLISVLNDFPRKIRLALYFLKSIQYWISSTHIWFHSRLLLYTRARHPAGQRRSTSWDPYGTSVHRDGLKSLEFRGKQRSDDSPQFIASARKTSATQILSTDNCPDTYINRNRIFPAQTFLEWLAFESVSSSGHSAHYKVRSTFKVMRSQLTQITSI